LLILPGLFLLTIWCLIVPVIVLEGAGVGASFSRSRQLVRGFEGKVFGTLVLVFLVLRRPARSCRTCGAGRAG